MESAEDQTRIALRSGPILSAVGFAANEFLKSSNWKDALDEALEHLGKAVRANRAYYFENGLSEDGDLQTSQIAEWVGPGITPQIQNSALQNVSYVADGMSRWLERMRQRLPVHGLVSDFPASERAILEAQNIRSLVVMPVFSHDEFVIDFKNKAAICPNGKEMIFITDNVETPSGPHMRFRGYLKDCRECPLNKKCMKREIKIKAGKSLYL